MAETQRHSLIEDAQAILFGGFMAAVGVLLLTHLGFVTGQTAGLALLISYGSGWGFAATFFAVNLPFYMLSYRRFGLAFMLKSFASVALTSLLVLLLGPRLHFGAIHPGVGAVLAGFVSGSALLALFRHGASLGGIGIVALYIQDRTGFRAGWTQMLVDAAIFGGALFLIADWRLVAWSFLGAVVMNLVIAINHRRDRYIA